MQGVQPNYVKSGTYEKTMHSPFCLRKDFKLPWLLEAELLPVFIAEISEPSRLRRIGPVDCMPPVFIFRIEELVHAVSAVFRETAE